MIGRLEGLYAGTTPEGAVLIDVAGVGYAVRVTAPTLARLVDQKKKIALLVHTSVREDAIDLYGFETGDELLFFKQLTSVSGIGPKSALGILNLSEVSHLKRSIAQGDATALTRVHGIGKKSAERIVVELRDKMMHEGKEGLSGAVGSDAEVMEALMALGYRAEESRHALQEVGKDISDVSGKVAAALKYLGSKHVSR